MLKARTRKTLIAAAVAVLTVSGMFGIAVAQPGSGYGPGMMGGYPGGGYGPGYGMNPGMMGGGLMGPGMMDGGMMDGGMMGGMGYVMLSQLNLTPEQWGKINAAHEELAKKNWELGGRMQEEGFKLRNQMTAEKRDRAAIVAQFKKLQEIRTQRFQTRLEAQDKVDGILTKEQKGQLRRFAPW